ncbi:BLUF domain-containing protein [Flavobacteriaceae bacterium M23B6Z8]
MIFINTHNPIEQLRRLSVFLEADFTESPGTASLRLDNKNGSGFINTFDIYEGLSVRTYNITFTKELKFSKEEEQTLPIYFLYCVEGYYYHKFEGSDEYRKICEMQNVIISSISGINNEIILPANVHLKLSVIFLNKNFDSERVLLGRRKNLETALDDMADFIENDKPFSYYGEINPMTAQYARVLINNKRTDVVGRLLTEGSVMNTLASQIDNHDRSKDVPGFTFPLSSNELKIMSDVSDYISRNLDTNLRVPKLAKMFGLTEKKLQLGCRYFYGESLGNLIRNIRMEKAKELIQTSDMTISEICYTVGFNNRSYFTKAFVSRYGIVPSKYKNSLDTAELVFELSYKSKIKKNVSKKDVEQLVKISRTKNETFGITGCLVFLKDYFFQVIEGNKSDILQLYENILKDERHHDVVVLTKKFNAQRVFPEWSLALISDDGELTIPQEGRAGCINLRSILAEEKPGVSSDIFWRRVLNIIKVSL